MAMCVYEELVATCPQVPPETGGILGGHDGVIVSYEFDGVGAVRLDNSYRPDVQHLNNRIRTWEARGVEFMGIFHSHPVSERALSMPDRGYIWRIMTSMPSRISTLYFPLVFPTCDLLAYVATTLRGTVRIDEDAVSLSESDIA